MPAPLPSNLRVVFAWRLVGESPPCSEWTTALFHVAPMRIVACAASAKRTPPATFQSLAIYIPQPAIHTRLASLLVDYDGQVLTVLLSRHLITRQPLCVGQL